MQTKMSFMHKPYDLRIEDVELPALKSNQVLIELKATGICGSDIHCYKGESDEGRYDIAPYTPGHEWSGKIIEIGNEVTTLNVGDNVIGDCVLACGVCENCKNGLMPSACLNMRELGFRPDSPGGFGYHMILEEEYTHKIPDDWSYDLGAWVEPFSVGYFGIWGNGGYVDASDYVLVMGAGPIGVAAAMVAKTSGALTIVAEPNQARAKIAKEFGADFVLDPTKDDFKEELYKLTNEKGPTLLVEASGNHNAIESLIDLAGHSCRVRLVGHSIGHKLPIELGRVIWKTLNITGAGGTKDYLPKTIRFMDRIKDDFDFDKLISHRFQFEELQEGIDIAVNDPISAFKVMVHFDH